MFRFWNFYKFSITTNFILLEKRFMRLVLFHIVMLAVVSVSAQSTVIPDSVFERHLIDLGVDSGIPDGSVLTANISSVTSLSMLFLDISDLTGIEDFSSLKTILCSYTLLTKIDFSQNLSLSSIAVHNNDLDTLILPLSDSLVLLNCGNNELTELTVSQYPKLEIIYCINNLITHLDFSQNTQLHTAQVYNNPLVCFSIRNGNNLNLISFGGGNSPDLLCIEVDSADWFAANWAWGDPVVFSNNCGDNCTGVGVGVLEEMLKPRALIKIIDLMGNESLPRKNCFLIYLYDNGTYEKIYHF